MEKTGKMVRDENNIVVPLEVYLERQRLKKEEKEKEEEFKKAEVARIEKEEREYLEKREEEDKQDFESSEKTLTIPDTIGNVDSSFIKQKPEGYDEGQEISKEKEEGEESVEGEECLSETEDSDEGTCDSSESDRERKESNEEDLAIEAKEELDKLSRRELVMRLDVKGLHYAMKDTKAKLVKRLMEARK